MVASSPSLHRALLSRELGGARGLGGHTQHTLRPSVEGFACDAAQAPGSGVMHIEPRGTAVPPFALRFASQHPTLLAVADEEGFVTLVDTLRPLDDAPAAQWEAHGNAIFDACFLHADAKLLTASGDQSVCQWDVERRARTAIFRGHTGSVKSVSARPSDESVFATGSRDGNLALWDSRQPATRCARTGALYTAPTHQVMAHATGRRPRRRRGIAGDTQQSVTQVMFLRDDALLASAGAADGTVKLWDVRALKKPVAALGAATEWGAPTAASSPATLHQRRLHGVCAIAQDDGGGRLVVARANDACYMYDVLRPENGPVARYAGAALRSFYIKADFAPGGTHFATGSSDRQVHIFEVDSPEDGPYTLQGHASEVTAVAWCKADVGRLATAADDGTVRVWSLERSGHGAVGIADEDVIDDPLHSAAKRGALVKRHRRALSAQARSMHGGRRVFGAPFRLDFSSPGRGDATAVPDDAEAAPAVAWAASAVVSSKDGHAEAPARAPSPSPGGAVPNKRPRVQTDIASFFGRISS